MHTYEVTYFFQNDGVVRRLSANDHKAAIQRIADELTHDQILVWDHGDHWVGIATRHVQTFTVKAID